MLDEAQWKRPMNCWVQARKNGPWHQGLYTGGAVRGTVTLRCSGKVIYGVWAENTMDYRWRPPDRHGKRCFQAWCDPKLVDE